MKKGSKRSDELHQASVILNLLLILINLFIRSRVLLVINAVLIVLCLIRRLAPDSPRRRAENEKFLELWGKIGKRYKMKKTALTDKEHYYKKCVKCRAYLRLPRMAGEHTAVCPKCGEKMVIKIK